MASNSPIGSQLIVLGTTLLLHTGQRVSLGREYLVLPDLSFFLTGSTRSPDLEHQPWDSSCSA